MISCISLLCENVHNGLRTGWVQHKAQIERYIEEQVTILQIQILIQIWILTQTHGIATISLYK